MKNRTAKKKKAPQSWRAWCVGLLARPLVWLSGIVVVATGAFLDDTIKLTLKKLSDAPLAKLTELTCSLRSVQTPNPATQFKILLSPLEGDDHGKLTARVQDVFRSESGLDVVPICQEVKFDRTKGNQESNSELRKSATEIISQNHADLLLFGSVLTGEKLEIYAVNEFGGCDWTPTIVLVDKGELSKQFDLDTKQQLVSASIAEIEAACLHPESVDLALFAKRSDKLKLFIEGSGANFDTESRWNLVGSYVNSASLLYKRTTATDWADKGISVGLANLEKVDNHSGDLLYVIGILHSAKYERTKAELDLDKAIEALGKASDSSLDYKYDAIVESGRLKLFYKRDLKAAIEDFSKAAAIDPKRDKAFYFRAIALRDDNQLEAATADATEAIRLAPEDVHDHAIRASIYLKSGAFESSIEDFSRALALGGTDDSILIDRGRAYFHKGDYDKAIADFTAVLQHNPVDAYTLTQRAFAYREKHELTLTIADLERVRTISPDDPASFYRLCATQNKAGMLSEALDNCSKAISLNPEFSFALDERGRILLKQKEFDRAIDDFSRAYSLNSKLPRAIYGRAICKREKGDSVGAETDFASAKKAQPTVVDEFNGL